MLNLTLMLALALGAPTTKDKKEPPKEESIVGVWSAVEGTFAGEGRPLPPGGVIFTFTEDGKASVAEGNRKSKGAEYSIDTTKSPKQAIIKSENKKEAMNCIYQFEKGKLILCINSDPKTGFPKDFTSTAENSNTLITFERMKKD